VGTDRLGGEAAWRLVLRHAAECGAGARGAKVARSVDAIRANAEIGAEASAANAESDVDASAAKAEGRLRIRPDGSWTVEGEVTPEASDLLDLFLPLAVRPGWVVGQLGQSLDGRIATESGHSHYVTGPDDRVRLHRLRALADAVVVGAGTAASDDPRLTVRSAEGESPVRVVLDPRGRLDAGLRLFTDGAAPTLWVQAEAREAAEADRTLGVEIVRLPSAGETGFEPAELVTLLRRRGLARILVEGGGTTVSRFLQARALDRLHVTVAPLLLGSGRPALTLPPIETLDEALRPPSRFFRMGDDLLVDLELDRARA
jgi:diaminohydroxyphosphoribosylaminopyrimidine deaminase / 5-amino-6-(5-phosphoribosylamino)uracil reductase